MAYTNGLGPPPTIVGTQEGGHGAGCSSASTADEHAAIVAKSA
jgi:hypothetical protein